MPSNVSDISGNCILGQKGGQIKGWDVDPAGASICNWEKISEGIMVTAYVPVAMELEVDAQGVRNTPTCDPGCGIVQYVSNHSNGSAGKAGFDWKRDSAVQCSRVGNMPNPSRTGTGNWIYKGFDMPGLWGVPPMGLLFGESALEYHYGWDHCSIPPAGIIFPTTFPGSGPFTLKYVDNFRTVGGCPVPNGMTSGQNFKDWSLNIDISIDVPGVPNHCWADYITGWH
jgi:hypothetical protein